MKVQQIAGFSWRMIIRPYGIFHEFPLASDDSTAMASKRPIGLRGLHAVSPKMERGWLLEMTFDGFIRSSKM